MNRETNPLAALIAGVTRFNIKIGEHTDPSVLMLETEVLAALEAAPVPDLVEAGKVLERLEVRPDISASVLTWRIEDEAADTIRALIAQNAAQAKAEGERDALRAKVAELEAQVERRGRMHKCLSKRWADARAEAATLRAKVERLRGAAIALRDDMLERSRSGIDAIHGEEYRIVGKGRTAWADFCAALEGKHE